MGYQHFCVVDGSGRYVTCVLAGEDGGVRNYTLKEGERLLAAPAPPLRVPGSGLLRPVWDGAAWRESAEEEEIAAWDAANALPEYGGPAPALERRVETLEAEAAALSAAIERGLAL